MNKREPYYILQDGTTFYSRQELEDWKKNYKYQTSVQEYINRAGFPKRYNEFTLDTFPQKTIAHKTYIQNIARFLDNWQLGQCLTFMGAGGEGKTASAIIAAKFMCQKSNRSVRFTNCGELADTIKSNNYSDKFINALKRYSIVVLDDIDKGASPAIWNFYFNLINYFYENLKTMIITTNTDLEKLNDTVIKNLYSRMQQKPSLVFKMGWGDLRRKE